MSKYNRNDSKKRDTLKPMKIRVTNNTYDLIDEIAGKFNMKKSVLVRTVLENRLEDFKDKCKYSDSEKADMIEGFCREMAKELRYINNNINRIGVNYNQEVKLKNAERKYKTVADDITRSPLERCNALEEYNKIKKEMTDIGIDMKELGKMLTEFRKSVTEMEDMLCHIQE